MKKLISLILAVLMVMSIASSALMESGGNAIGGLATAEPGPKPEPTGGDDTKTMYVYTENGGPLNVRREPMKASDNLIGQLEYGAKVQSKGVVPGNPDWTEILYSKGVGGVAYVMTRYLQTTRPTDIEKRAEEAKKRAEENKKRTEEEEQKKKEEEQKKSEDELKKLLASVKTLETPLLASVRASRTSGWANFRLGPAVSTQRVASLPDGQQLKLIGETDKWYQAVDTESGKTGFISKSYVTILSEYIEPETQTDEKALLGKLSVNGEFTIQCKLPEGYELQVVNRIGSKIVASVLSPDKEKPMMYLSIAFDELYSDVERMNDLDEEALKTLEESYTDMNDVEIAYGETAYGTKLMIVKEVGEDTDFVDILSVYKGYFVEFIMTPNAEAENKKLTDEQIQMCIDFLSEVDFVPAE